MACINQDQRRRWMRHDAHRYIRHDVERFFLPGRCPEELKPRHRKDTAERFLRQPTENLELALSPEAVEAIENERLAIRGELALLRLELALLRFKYSSNQPRVPAGSPDAGQWTSDDAAGGGSPRTHLANTSRNDPRVLSDVTADDILQPGAQYAQNETQRRYSVNLQEEEVRGGHTLRDHVGKSDAELLGRVRGDRGEVGIYRYARPRQGSFQSAESANDLVNRTLERNQQEVDRVASGQFQEEFINTRFGYKTGREAFRPTIDLEPYLRDTYEVGVYIKHDPRSAKGYRVHTAYPRNSHPR